MEAIPSRDDQPTEKTAKNMMGQVMGGLNLLPWPRKPLGKKKVGSRGPKFQNRGTNHVRGKMQKKRHGSWD